MIHLCNFDIDAQAFSNAFFGQGTTPIYLDAVQCSGSEVNIFACPSITTPNCGQADNAGVQCHPTGRDYKISDYCYCRSLIMIMQLFVEKVRSDL